MADHYDGTGTSTDNQANGKTSEQNGFDQNDSTLENEKKGKSMKKKFSNFKKMFKRTKKKKDGLTTSYSEEDLSSQMKAQSEPDLLSKTNDAPPQMHRYNSQVTKPNTELIYSEGEEQESKDKNGSFKRDAQQYIRSSLRKFKIKRRKSGSDESSNSEQQQSIKPPIVAEKPRVPGKPIRKENGAREFDVDSDDTFFTKVITPRKESPFMSPDASFDLADVKSNVPRAVETTAAKDRIRVAPQGRRKPSRYRSPPPPSPAVNSSLQKIDETDSTQSSKRNSQKLSRSRESSTSEVVKKESFGERTYSDSQRPKPTRRPKQATSHEEITSSSSRNAPPQRSKSTNSRENVNVEKLYDKPRSTHTSHTKINEINEKSQSLGYLPKTNSLSQKSDSHEGFARPEFSRNENDLHMKRSNTAEFYRDNKSSSSRDKSSSSQSFHKRSMEKLFTGDDNVIEKKERKQSNGSSKRDSIKQSKESLHKKSQENLSTEENIPSDMFFKSEALTSAYNMKSLKQKDDVMKPELVNKRNSLKNSRQNSDEQVVKRNSLNRTDESMNDYLIHKKDSLKKSREAINVSKNDSFHRSKEDLSSNVLQKKESLRNSRENLSTNISKKDSLKSHETSTKNIPSKNHPIEIAKANARQNITNDVNKNNSKSSETTHNYGETTFALTSPTHDLELPPDFLEKKPEVTKVTPSSSNVVLREKTDTEKHERPLSVKIRASELQTSSKQTLVTTTTNTNDIKDLGKSLKPAPKPRPSPRPRPNVTSPTNDSTGNASEKPLEFNRISLKKVPKTNDFLGDTKDEVSLSQSEKESEKDTKEMTNELSSKKPVVYRKETPDLPTKSVSSPKTLSKSNDMTSRDLRSPPLSTSPVTTSPTASPTENATEPEFRRFSLKSVPKRQDYHATEENATAVSPTLTQPNLPPTQSQPNLPPVERKKEFDRQRSSSVGRKSPLLPPKPRNIGPKPFSFVSQDIVRSKSVSTAEAQRLRERMTSPVENTNEQPSWVKLAKAKQHSEDDETKSDKEEVSVKPSAIKSTSPTSTPQRSYTISSRTPPQPTNLGTPTRTVQSFKSRVDTTKQDTCVVCGKTAYMFERCEVDKRTLHKNCAKCESCGRKLNVGGIYMHDDKPYCSQHKQS